MRFPIAALVFAVLLIIAAMGYIVTSLVIAEVADALTTPANLALLGSRASDFQDNIATLNTAFGLSVLILFIMLCIAFVVDALRTEPEDYYGGNL